MSPETEAAGVTSAPQLTIWAVAAAYLAVGSSFLVLLSSGSASATRLGREDGLIEDAGALLFCCAALFAGIAYLRSAGAANKFFGWPLRRNVYFLLLATFFLVCAGEEISWGQRIFGWATPELVEEVNAQRETNLHNMWLFQANNSDGSVKSDWQLLLNMNRLFSLFWLAYCCIAPALAKLWQPARAFFAYSGVPLPPLALGGLFIVNFVAFRMSVWLSDADRSVVQALDELKETNYAGVFAVITLLFATRATAALRVSGGAASLPTPLPERTARRRF